MKYEELLNEWLDSYIRISIKQRTYIRYKEIIDLHIVPSLGKYEINEIVPIMIQKFIIKLLSEKNDVTNSVLSTNTVNGIISVIKSSFKYALLLGLINNDIIINIKRPKAIEKSVECFTLLEQKQIEKYIDNKNKDYLYGIIICFYTGLRIGELLALKWDDIDFINGELYVNKTCYYGKAKNGNFCMMTNNPKTDSSNRIIPIPREILKMLKKIKKNSTSNYVISNHNKQINVRSYQRTFTLILNKLSISHKGFHSIRHTFATRALECNMDVKTLAEILGHKNPTITLKRYAHSLMKHKKEMMNKIGMLFERK